MISFRITEIRWTNNMLNVEGSLCVGANDVLQSQTLQITRAELEKKSFKALVAEKSKVLATDIPQFVLDALGGVNSTTVNTTARKRQPKREVKSAPPKEPEVKLSFMDKLRQKIKQ